MFKTFILTIFLGLFLWFFCEITLFYILSPKGYKERNVYKPYGWFHKLFLDFPRQLGKDLASRDINFFNASGLIIFEGRQGSGKTISAVRECSLLKARFPECKVYSNTDLIFQDGGLVDWTPLTKLDNGIYGMVYLLDEISICFNNRAWSLHTTTLPAVTTPSLFPSASVLSYHIGFTYNCLFGFFIT